MAALLAHRPALVRFLTARLGDTAEAEDALQDLYLKLRASPPQGAPDAPLAYLYRAAASVALDRIRSRGRGARRDAAWTDSQTVMAGDEAVADSVPADEALIARERLAQLAAAVAALPAQARRVFTRLKLDGLSHAEVAAELGISKSAVEKNIATAMRHLSLLRDDP
ncbi:MAG: sigma-70 family RNA polymerase sigma factor [Alphaproteobacteria bacterium]|nr:sigma-70 family RNA polymerase sigma factor [Alphaproteobacteria bacterium]